MADEGKCDVDPGDKAVTILQTLVCYLREKNILSRADIERLADQVSARIAQGETHLPSAVTAASAAAMEMRRLDDFCGRKYGGKHSRRVS
ncbi:hypothetical protein [Novosphingobium sp. BL-52-GroH]|uniref:hypothetical protein n=1 Tax=Novosphingobium sp. BL-52-GroH TaxID=3349877 RepID=UPI00384F21DD